MTTARVYLRLSRDDPASTSLERQEADCRALALRLGATGSVLYAEPPGTSAYTTGPRPARDHLLADLCDGDLVVAWALDRLTRGGMAEAGTLLLRIDEAGARLVTVADGVDTSRDSEDLPVAIRAVMAREESKRISTRTRSAKALIRSSGHLVGRAPWGLRRRSDGKVEPDPSTEVEARRVLAGIRAGLSLTAISADLNTRGVPAARGGSWSPARLSNWAASPTLAGLQSASPGEVLIDERGAPVSIGTGLVTPDEWWSARSAITARTLPRPEGGRRGRRPGLSLLVGGIGSCGRCGGTLVASGPREGATKSYRCLASWTRGVEACRGISASVRRVDEEVSRRFLGFVFTLDPTDDLAYTVAERWAYRGSPATLEVDAARAAVEQADVALERLEDLLVDGTLRREAFARQQKRLLAHRAVATGRLEALVAARAVNTGVLFDTDALVEAWGASSVLERHELLGLVADSVTIKPSERGRGQRFDPARVGIRWAEPSLGQ